VEGLEDKLQSGYAMVRRNFEITKLNNKRNYDRKVHIPKFEVGIIVLLRDGVHRDRSKNQHM
jgi:hypothetical protein